MIIVVVIATATNVSAKDLQILYSGHNIPSFSFDALQLATISLDTEVTTFSTVRLRLTTPR